MRLALCQPLEFCEISAYNRGIIHEIDFYGILRIVSGLSGNSSESMNVIRKSFTYLSRAIGTYIQTTQFAFICGFI